jgi:formate dehydrogenase subunit delta
MANDIAAQFAHQPLVDAATAVAGHIRMFWDPRMRGQLGGLDQSGRAQLHEIARAALAQLDEGQG